jgi:DHA1 family tetracycline resistance protein-like MFS transporter
MLLPYNRRTMSSPTPQEYSSAPNADPTPPPAKSSLGIIFLIVFMDLLGFGIIIPLQPFYATRYEASPLQVTILFSVYSIFQFVAAPVLGVISDRYGRRPVLILSQIGSALGYVMLGAVTQYHWTNLTLALWMVYVSRIIDGISGGNISTAQAYIADVTSAENRSKGLGIIGAAFGIGFTLGPAFGGLLAGPESAPHPWWPGYAAAFFSLVAAGLTWWKLPESREHKPVEAEAWLHPRVFKPILRKPRLRHLLLIGTLSMGAFVMMEATIAIYLARPDTFGWSMRSVGLYLSFVGLIIAVVQGGLVGRLSKQFGEWPLTTLGPMLVAAGMMLFVAVDYHPVLYVLLPAGVLNAVGRSIGTPTLFALISKSTSPEQQGTVFGLQQGLMSIARVVGPPIAGVAYTHHPTSPYWLCAIAMVVVTGWLVLARKLPTDPAVG